MAFWPFDYTEATDVDENNDFSGGGGLLRSGKKQRKWKFITIREWLQGALVFLNGLRLIPSRVAIKEFTSDPLTDSGWYEIARISASALSGGGASISVGARGLGRVGTASVDLSFINSTEVKSTLNTFIEFTKRSTFVDTFETVGNPIKGMRIAKHNSLNDAGAKLEVYLDISEDVVLQIQLNGNVAPSTVNKGWELVTPTDIDVDKTPDGSTATFLEAGKELSLDNGNIIADVSFVTARKIGSDSITLQLRWNQLPKPATAITLTNSSSGIAFVDGDGSISTLGSYTESNLIFNGRDIYMRITQTGLGTPLNSGPLSMRVSGNLGKFTLS